MEFETRPIKDLKWREDLKLRTLIPALVQQYASDIELLPAIEINQNDEIIDGLHRWKAFEKAEQEEIPVYVTYTENEKEFIKLAAHRNATHGAQWSKKDKQAFAIAHYDKFGKQELAQILSVTERTIYNWTSDIDNKQKEQNEQRVLDLYLSCHTQDEIALQIFEDDSKQTTIKNWIDGFGDLSDFENFQKLINLNHDPLYNQDDYKIPIYDIWNISKHDFDVDHYGNVPVTFVDNLLWTFTEPYDIVIDPFAGSGSTIDVCKKRLRRYWVSDRAPIPERKDIKKHDLVKDGITGPYHWGDVALVYLDPPYWKQAQYKYSKDPTDLANMPLEQFTETLVNIIQEYGKKIPVGAHIACIISPTQWPNEDKHTDYHDVDLIRAVDGDLKLVRRVICPYSTEQYNGTQVNIAKAEKLWLVLSRTILVWEKIA